MTNLFRVVPTMLFFLLLLLPMVSELKSDDVINSNGETKMFILFLRQNDYNK